MPRRDMLSPLTSPNGVENAMRATMRSLRDALRAPVRVPPTQVKAPAKKAAPGPTPAPLTVEFYCDSTDPGNEYGEAFIEFADSTPNEKTILILQIIQQDGPLEDYPGAPTITGNLTWTHLGTVPQASSVNRRWDWFWAVKPKHTDLDEHVVGSRFVVIDDVPSGVGLGIDVFEVFGFTGIVRDIPQFFAVADPGNFSIDIPFVSPIKAADAIVAFIFPNEYAEPPWATTDAGASFYGDAAYWRLGDPRPMTGGDWGAAMVVSA
jgi:hypothetical protein